MAKIIVADGTSHVPAVGAAIDHHLTGEPYWQLILFTRGEYKNSTKPNRQMRISAKPPRFSAIIYQSPAATPTNGLGPAAL